MSAAGMAGKWNVHRYNSAVPQHVKQGVRKKGFELRLLDLIFAATMHHPLSVGW